MPDLDDDDDYIPPDEDEVDEAEENELDAAELDPLLASDPRALVRRLSDRAYELEDRIAAQDFVKRIEDLSADLARGNEGRAADKRAESARKAEARAARIVPSGMKSATRAIGRLLARCEEAVEDLTGALDGSLDLETRVKVAATAARLASAASSLGHAMSSSARTRAQLMRLRSARAPRTAGDAHESET